MTTGKMVMTDWEKALAHWLPDEWTPELCKGRLVIPSIANVDWVCMECRRSFDSYVDTHTIPCPSPSRDLGFRLLEVTKFDCTYSALTSMWIVGPRGTFDSDLLTAITKAAAALASKEQK